MFTIKWRGTGGGEIGRKGGGRRGGRMQNYNGGGKREKCKEVGANKHRAGTRVKGDGKEEV